jgi:hypothetical protein
MFNNTTGFRIDDYRSPLCAALNIANFFQSSNILLLSCDNAFADERPGSEKLENNMYSYPQHKISQEIVDTMAFFMKRENPEIKIGDCSNGWKYDNISNISNVSEFFI